MRRGYMGSSFKGVMPMLVDKIAQAIAIVLAGMTLIQIAPIKIDPWTALARAIGRALNHDISVKVDALSGSVSKLEKQMQEKAAIDARSRILVFGDECRRGVHHSKDCFDAIFEDITTYEQYCTMHPKFKNNMTNLTVQYINNIFSRCLETNDFL